MDPLSTFYETNEIYDNIHAYFSMNSKLNNSFSLLIPVYNEEDNIEPLIEKLVNSLKKLSVKQCEIIFIDDGSTDRTNDRIKSKIKNYKFIKLIKLRRNFGKAAAYSVGIRYAKYDIIVTMDGDLQDDPDEIGLFLEKINQGYAMVVGWKHSGKGKLSKTIISTIFNFVASHAFNIKLHDLNCPFKAYKKEVFSGLKIYSGLYRFIPIFANSYGFSVTEIKIKNLPRLRGKSKYGGIRLVTGLFDFITAFFLIKFNLKPMYLFGSLALIAIIIGTVILGYLTVLSFGGQAVGSRPLFFLGVLLEIMSLQFFSIGFIAELFTRNLIDIDPKFLVEKLD